jgi:glycosyltransferase involved in cell wall biosynthesis
MITVGYSTRKSSEEFKELLRKSSGHPKIEIIEKVNPDGRSLTEVYNEILEESTNDIVVLCHDDIYFDTKNWVKKLVRHFEKNPHGIIGLAGTSHMPKSGMWWEDRSKMYGIVNHESEGKKWESKYSSSLGDKLKDVVIVDGLFICLSKSRIKKRFDETVEGFHFYDVNFSFQNFLEGVQIGVMFDIRVTHKSIGMTNEKWERNRIQFSERYSSELPKIVPKKKSEKLKILLSCLFFKTFTGSEVYVYELARTLVGLGHDVTVLSDVGKPLEDMAKRLGIKTYSLQEPPGFKLGDGKWSLNTPQGMVVSTPNTMYKVSEVNFDIIHVQHEPTTNFICQLYPNIPKISTIHSEVISLEKPVINDTIREYICIRPEIQQHIIDVYEIPKDKTSVIYNPVDKNRFSNKNTNVENAVLFVGSIDYLRENTIKDLISYSKENGKELWLVGDNKSNYLQDILKNTHVKYFNSTWKTEDFIKRVSETAGILLGRTTIESWFCGKPAWIYKVDSSGNILDKNLITPPSNEELNKFDSNVVVELIEDKYYKLINQGA